MQQLTIPAGATFGGDFFFVPRSENSDLAAWADRAGGRKQAAPRIAGDAGSSAC